MRSSTSRERFAASGSFFHLKYVDAGGLPSRVRSCAVSRPHKPATRKKARKAGLDRLFWDGAGWVRRAAAGFMTRSPSGRLLHIWTFIKYYPYGEQLASSG